MQTKTKHGGGPVFSGRMSNASMLIRCLAPYEEAWSPVILPFPP